MEESTAFLTSLGVPHDMAAATARTHIRLSEEGSS